MPKRHVGSLFHGLKILHTCFLYYSPHYTIYLFCISQHGINKEERCRKTKHRALSIAEKIKISKKLDNNMFVQTICETYVIGS